MSVSVRLVMKYKSLLLQYVFVCVIGFTIVTGMPRPVFKFSSSNYVQILRTNGFVDKTLLIRNIIDHKGVALITAPPKFGKSTNLDMLKRFLEIEVNEDGSSKTKANFTTDPVRDTGNYALFVKNKLKITKNETFMDTYFGKTPVIKADFRCFNTVRTFDEAVEFCKQVIHNTFKEHKYLLNSDQLTNHQKMLFERWYNDTTYTEMTKQHIAHGLRVLSVYLYRHFNKSRVFVIIDEHDSVIGKAMFDVQGAGVLRKIIALSVSVMSTALKNNDIYVKGGLISGISDIPVFGFSDLNNVKTYGFLEQHQFLDFYGLTKNEVDALFSKPEFELNSSAIKDAHAAYNGYQTEKEKKIYNIYSVMRFLKTGEVKDYWTKFGTIKKLRNVFKIPAFKHYVDKLAEGKSITIAILDKLAVEDVIDLRNLLLNPQSQINYWPATLFNFLLKQGYLTFLPSRHKQVGVSVRKSTVKLPNTEVTSFILKLK